jgi:hypothetical protein
MVASFRLLSSLLKMTLTPRPPLPNLGEGVPEAEQRVGVRACYLVYASVTSSVTLMPRWRSAST